MVRRDDIYVDVSRCVSANISTNAPKMLISEPTDCHLDIGTSIDIAGTFVYNEKVNRAKAISQFPDSLYSCPLFTMNYEKKLLKEKEVCELRGFSKSTLWRLVGRGDFPNPIRFGSRMTRWNSYDVHMWIDKVCYAAN